MFGELAYSENVAANRFGRVVSTLEFFQHALAKWGHRNLLSWTPTLSLFYSAPGTMQLRPPRQRLTCNALFVNLTAQRGLAEPRLNGGGLLFAFDGLSRRQR